MRINEVEQLVGIPKKNIRFYEAEGLLRPSRSADNGYRDYGEAEVAALHKIKLLRQLAVPLEDIRSLQNGELTLESCMQRQQDHLARQAQNLLQIQQVCLQLADSHTDLAAMDVADWQARIQALERTGTQFMDVKKDHRKKLVGPTIITVVLVVLLAALELLLYHDLIAGGQPLAVAVALLALPLAAAAGLISALWLRVREIQGGEEDEAAQY